MGYKRCQMAVKLLIADDDALARALIEAIVERDAELELVGSAEDAEGAIALAGEHQPDVAVLDWVMPGGGGPVATREILNLSPGTKIVALTAPGEPGAEADRLRAGARTSLVKGCPPDELLRTIRNAAAG
jgi:DNA-binding NarL/FixJ family response regulator